MAGLDNEWVVYVSSWKTHEDAKCIWLGHAVWKCGHCKKAYLYVESLNDYEKLCPECGWAVDIRFVGRK